MRIRYFVDPDSGVPHVYDHGVNEEEVEEVLHRPVETREGSEGSRVAIGHTLAGRILRVIYEALRTLDRRNSESSRCLSYTTGVTVFSSALRLPSSGIPTIQEIGCKIQALGDV